ncbi:hypothetical protein VPH35_007144 [Triticum aestivum]
MDPPRLIPSLRPSTLLIRRLQEGHHSSRHRRRHATHTRPNPTSLRRPRQPGRASPSTGREIRRYQLRPPALGAQDQHASSLSEVTKKEITMMVAMGAYFLR